MTKEKGVAISLWIALPLLLLDDGRYLQKIARPEKLDTTKGLLGLSAEIAHRQVN